jgi:UDP-N-acetylglucosamine--N-acetylmuramyl-(pentapeptide) pyrophosphoryl-undecaprenol N-acetylglucosamine transferase
MALEGRQKLQITRTLQDTKKCITPLFLIDYRGSKIRAGTSNKDILAQTRMQTTKHILLTGGGTAGHVNPALAIGSVLSSADTHFLFVGVRGRVEEEVVPREGIPIKYVRASGLPSGFSLRLVKFGADLLLGILQSVLILLRFRPQIIIGTGGYVSAPVIMAASLLRKLHLLESRVFIHEQNAVPGKLNQLMGRFAHRVLVTFPETLSFFPQCGTVVGYPLRRRISRVGREEARQKASVQIPDGRKVVLAFGGSQGSRTINRALVDALRHLLPYRERLFIIHGAGLFRGAGYNSMADTEARLRRSYDEKQLKEIEDFYTYRDFFHDIEFLYALSDLVVVRGGAGSLNEISAMGLPALIIPKANLPADHQVMNARAMERAGGAEILYEQIAPVDGKLSEWVDGKILAEKLLSILEDESCLGRMRERSASFLNHNALDLIGRLIRGEETGQEQVPASIVDKSGAKPLPGNRALLLRLEKASSRYRAAYRPEMVISRPQDLEYLKNRACALLIHPAWQERNLGIKLLGLLHAKEKIPVLLAIFHDRKPASLLKRLFGGDFEQVGFIRRNVIAALERINEINPDVERALLSGLADPYYEVRAESARAAAFFGSRLSYPGGFVSALLQLLTDTNIDVCTAAAEALGKIGSEHDALPALLKLWDSRFWKFRAAVLRGILYLVDRGKIAHLEDLEAEVPKFILTSTDFAPRFEIKAVYRQVIESVSRKKEERAGQ